MTVDSSLVGTYEDKDDAGKPPEGTVARWLAELRLADKEQRTWVKQAETAFKRYSGDANRKTGKSNSGFNILWSNTETLRPALYNSVPNPDVRRRFKDPDPIARYVSEVMERALAFSLDDEDFDGKMPSCVLDMLLAGRSVARVRYVPSFHTPEGVEPKEDQEGYGEEVAWERATFEPVHWEDFRHGPGRCWSEVNWIAFRHKLTKDQLDEKFGKVSASLPLEEADLGEKTDDKLDPTVFKRATVWEIWDKDERKVVWIHPLYKDGPIREDADPLELVDFFPIPRPMVAVERSDSLTPVTLYSLYESQAEELDKITIRIQKIVSAIRARGAYDSTLGDLSEILKGNDNELISLPNAIAVSEKGGLDKFIWFAPIEMLVNVARELLAQREAIKQTIYEITGLSDIVRGTSDPNETASAQRIKSQWGSIRLQRMQREVQRFARDLLRIKAEIISEQFSPETLKIMTGVQLPMLAEKQMALMQWQQQAAQAQIAGQQPPPQPDIPPAWEEVLQIMRDDSLRSYRIDIETDSTIQDQLAEDQQALAAGMDSIGRIMSVPMPFEVQKAILQSWSKRSKMGREVQDVLDKMQPPPPQPNPDMIKAQQSQQEMQANAQLEQQRMQHEMALADRQAEHQAAADQQKAQTEQAKLQAEMEIKRIDVRIKELDLQMKMIEVQSKSQESQMNAVAQSEQIEADREARADGAVSRQQEQEFAQEQHEASLNARDSD